MISVVCSVAGSTNGSHATPARETTSAQISHRRYSTVSYLPVTSYIPTDTNGDLITEAKAKGTYDRLFISTAGNATLFRHFILSFTLYAALFTRQRV